MAFIIIIFHQITEGIISLFVRYS